LKKSHDIFKIEHIDPLGQGVSKTEEDVFFVYNTLEGEEGTADVDGQKKGVSFGHLPTTEQLTKVSPHRVHPECPHFFSCNGCHFLHTPYQNEISIKLNSLKRSLKLYERKTGNLTKEESIFSHQSEERFNTRNRIQLHYDLSKKRLGLIGHKKNQIIEVPECLIGTKEIQEEIKKLYKDESWIKIIPKNSPKNGHIEIIANANSEVSVVFNHPYSHGGFTQVNQKMNKVLRNLVTKHALECFSDSDVIFDLFGGSGNLSKKIKNKPCIIYDSYGDGMLVEKDGHQEFIRQNLYSKKAPEIIVKKLQQHTNPGVIIDPPRSGLKNITDFFPENSNVKNIIYVSCNPATLFRDIANLKNYKIEHIHLVDLFPCTFHYETVCVLSKNK